MGTTHLGLTPPSDWVQRWAHLAPASGAILDVASGTGRHAQLFADKGCAVTAIDVSSEALIALQARAPLVRCVQADIEHAPWPLMQGGKLQTFDLIVVTNYLHRALMPILLASLAKDGVLIYETFAVGHEAIGRPTRPDFLLKSGELLAICAGLHITAYEEGLLLNPQRIVQRIVARQQATKMHPLLHPI